MKLLQLTLSVTTVSAVRAEQLHDCWESQYNGPLSPKGYM